MNRVLVKKVRVKNSLGLHTRPATMIVKLLENVQSAVTFTYKNETIDAKSILNILMLGVQKDALITIRVIGEDALETMERLIAGFNNRFGEDFHVK